MIGSIINGGGQSQVPASRAFDIGQAPQNPANTPKVPDAPQAIKAPDSFVSSGQTEEINQNLALSRDVSRPDPSQISSNVQNRGSLLDIVI